MTWKQAKAEALRRFGDLRWCLMTFAYWTSDEAGEPCAVVGLYVTNRLLDELHPPEHKVIMGTGRDFAEAFANAPSGDGARDLVLNVLRAHVNVAQG